MSGISGQPVVRSKVVVEATPIIVSMEQMDSLFDRSAGRWCDVCDAHGSHHTEKHNEFAAVARDFTGGR